MTVAVFRSRLNPQFRERYVVWAQELDELAREKAARSRLNRVSNLAKTTSGNKILLYGTNFLLYLIWFLLNGTKIGSYLFSSDAYLFWFHIYLIELGSYLFSSR